MDQWTGTLDRNVCQQNIPSKLREKVFRTCGLLAKKIGKVIESKLRWLPEMCKWPGKNRKKHKHKAKQNNKTLMS